MSNVIITLEEQTTIHARRKLIACRHGTLASTSSLSFSLSLSFSHPFFPFLFIFRPFDAQWIHSRNCFRLCFCDNNDFITRRIIWLQTSNVCLSSKSIWEKISSFRFTIMFNAGTFVYYTNICSNFVSLAQRLNGKYENEVRAASRRVNYFHTRPIRATRSLQWGEILSLFTSSRSRVSLSGFESIFPA